MRSNIARTWPSSRTPVEATAYLSEPRKSISALNFCGGRVLNDGIGAVGLISVLAIAWRGRRDAMSVSGGPGPSLPLSPILWQARQPDWAATSLPALNCATAVDPCWTTLAGGGIWIAVVEPALAPSNVRKAIAPIVRIAAVVAIGRRSGRRSGPRS